MLSFVHMKKHVMILLHPRSVPSTMGMIALLHD